MSDVQNNSVEEPPTTEPSTTQQMETKIENVTKPEPSTEAAIVESTMPHTANDESKLHTINDESNLHNATEESHHEPAAVEGVKDEAPATEKVVEPITEGQLALKGPGLLKSIIPSKKEFWLSDDAVSPQDLNSYMRGEKPEIAHAVVAWASQTGKGLLFFNKKGDTTRKQPGHVLALYDATDLRKESPHEIAFKLNGQEHVLKAANDAERDGWFMSLEKAMEMGKASKEETRESEGYKAEMEKLNKPNVAVGGAAGAKRSQSQPKKSVDVERTDGAQRTNSDLEDADNKDKKTRSTSRGVLERLKGKKDEKKEEKEEKGIEQEQTHPADGKHEEVAAGAGAVGGATAGTAAFEGLSSEDKKEESLESPVDATPRTEEKPKKRNSIFGKWGSMMSPTKEKEQKDAELKPAVPPKDEPVSENPPQISDTTPDSTLPTAEEIKAEAEAKPELTEEKKDITTPAKEKPNFLSSLSFMGKRNRSVSPSTNIMKHASTMDEAALADAPKETEPIDEVKKDEAVPETTTTEPLKPTEEPAKTEKAERRESVLGSLGRRASKAFKGMQTPKKENAAPRTEAKEEAAAAAPTEDRPTTNGEIKTTGSEQPSSIGDVVPSAVTAGSGDHQPAAVAASA